MGPGRDRTRDPWICSQTRICCQTRYRLRYAARWPYWPLLQKGRKIPAICESWGWTQENLILLHDNHKAQISLYSLISTYVIWYLGSYSILTGYMQNFSVLACLCSSADWSVPCLVGNPEDGVSRITTHVIKGQFSKRIIGK